MSLLYIFLAFPPSFLVAFLKMLSRKGGGRRFARAACCSELRDSRRSFLGEKLLYGELGLSLKMLKTGVVVFEMSVPQTI